MAENKDLKVDELNFDLIKANFKSYLQSQDEFRDYNFEGSGINTLLDLLAYNTYYNSFYLNMASAEAFLSTAQKRNSVVALAKSLNYTPRSRTGARISGTITVTPTASPASIVIPKYTEFTGSVDGRTYTFLTTEGKTVFSNENYTTQVDVVEGRLITTRYSVSSVDSDQRFIIPNANVDTRTITVRVLNSALDNTSRTFTLNDNFVELNSTDQVYFIEEVEDGQFQIKFGDGIFGVELSSGNIVIIEYLVTNGKDANDILNLTYADSIPGVTTIAYNASGSASGGADRESINSIRFNAPKSYESQNRAVTAEDYRALLLNQSIVDSVAVWGGEDNDPPAFGKVYIAIKPTIGEFLTATEKQNLIDSVINPKKIITVSTEIVDPSYIFLAVNATVKYDSNKTTLTSDSIRQLILETIREFAVEDIGQFSKYLRYSKLSRDIDTTDKSILNSILDLQLKIETPILLGASRRYDVNFSNPINPITEGRFAGHPFGVGNQITSNRFTFAGQTGCLLDDNNGIIRVYRVVGSDNIGVSSNVGTIDYDTGKIILTNFNPTAFADGGNTLKLTAIPKDKDIFPLRNQILRIRDEDVIISMIDDNTINLFSR